MSESTRTRLDAATGALFALLMTTALVLPGQPPKADDAVETVIALLVDRRRAFLVGGYVAGLAAMAFLWFVSALCNYLRGRDAAEHAGAIFIAGVFAISSTITGVMLIGGVAFAAARFGDPAVVRALNDAGTFLIETSKFGFAVLLLAAARSGAPDALPRGLRTFALVSVPLVLLSALALVVDGGIFQFGGVVDLAGGAPPLLWIVAASVVMMRNPLPAVKGAP